MWKDDGFDGHFYTDRASDNESAQINSLPEYQGMGFLPRLHPLSLLMEVVI